MFGNLVRREFFQDRPVLVMTGVLIVSALYIIGQTLLNVEAFDYKVAVRYTEIGPDSFPLGDWFAQAEPAIFAGIMTLLAILISARLHHTNRSLSFTVLVLQQLVLIFLFFVVTALFNTPQLAG